jgi:hypothetical protein
MARLWTLAHIKKCMSLLDRRCLFRIFRESFSDIQERRDVDGTMCCSMTQFVWLLLPESSSRKRLLSLLQDLATTTTMDVLSEGSTAATINTQHCIPHVPFFFLEAQSTRCTLRLSLSLNFQAWMRRDATIRLWTSKQLHMNHLMIRRQPPNPT